MRRPSRLAVAHLIYVLTERGMRDAYCSCRRPVPAFMTDDLRDAIDAVEKALQEEPEGGIGEWIEVD
jgi:hypothetical protein